MMQLYVGQGPQQGQTIALIYTHTVIGRGRECQIQLHDSQVSRRHAEIRQVGANQYQITDLGSANGTCLNGVRIQGTHSLVPNSWIQMGSTALLFQTEPATQPALPVVGDRPGRRTGQPAKGASMLWPALIVGVGILMLLAALLLTSGQGGVP